MRAPALLMSGATDPGTVRQSNEDAFWCDAGLGAAIVADGMGGHAAGEVASAATVEAFAEIVARRLPAAAGTAQVKELMAEALGTANSRVRGMIEADPQKEGMGSTAVCVCRHGNEMVIAHIGDSRAYLFRRGRLTPLTKDHSYVQSLVDSGALSPVDAEKHPQRNLITRCIGGDSDARVDLTALEFAKGDLLLLCSDGLSGVLGAADMEGLLTEAASLSGARDRLLEHTIARGAPDNVTLLLAGLPGWYGWRGQLGEGAKALLRPAVWRAGQGRPQAEALWGLLRLAGGRWAGQARLLLRRLSASGTAAWGRLRRRLPF